MRSISLALAPLASLLLAPGCCFGGTASPAPVIEVPEAVPAAPEAPTAAPTAGTPSTTLDAQHFPTALAQDLTAPAAGSRTLSFPDMDFFKVVLPTGLDFGRGPRVFGDDDEGFAGGVWYRIDGAAAPVAIYTHNPAGDSGAECPTIDQVRASLAGAELTVRQLWVDGDDLNPVDVVLFQRGADAGFYVHRSYDHGDDATDYCASFGTKDAPFTFTTTSTPEEARRVAGALVTAYEDFGE